MRIALLTHQFPSARLGGIGAYSLHNAHALAAAGHHVHLFTLSLPPDARPALPPTITLHEIHILTPAQPPAACAELLYRLTLADAFAGSVLAAHRHTPFDLVETPEYEALGLALAQSELPLVTHLHSGSAIAREAGNASGGASAEQAMREALELELLAAADATCAPSRAVVHDTFHAYGIGEPPFPCEILPLPFEPSPVPFTIPPANGPVLFIGRLERLKGAHLLAQAAIPFLQQHPAATIQFLGPDTMTAPAPADDGSPPRSMADCIRATLPPHLLARITLEGEASREQIAAALHACAFVALPSLRESYSYVACEALAAGRPVVVSSDIGATEVVADAGLAFARGNAEALAGVLSHLWQNSGLQADLARVAYDRARTVLASAATTPARVQFYEDVIAARRRHGITPIPARLASLPAHFATRAAAARQLAQGNADRAIRLLASTGVAWDSAALTTPGSRLVHRLNNYPGPKAGRGGGGLQFYLYGAGRHTERLLQEQSRWEAHGHRLIGLIDDHPRFTTQPTFRNLPVLSLHQAQKRLGLADILILSTDTFEDQFWSQTAPLRTKGVTVYRLYGA